jgi:hypothetical protein
MSSSDICVNLQDLESNKKKRGRPRKCENRTDYLKQNYQKNKENYKQKYDENKEQIKEYNKSQQEKYRRCYQIIKKMIEKNEIPSSYKDEVNLICT